MAAPSLAQWQSFISTNLFGAEQMLIQQQTAESNALSIIHERAALLFLHMAWTGLLQSLARQQGLQLSSPTLDDLEQGIGHGTAETGLLRQIIAERNSWLAAMLNSIAEICSAQSAKGDSAEVDEQVASDQITVLDIVVSPQEMMQWSGCLRALVYQLESSSLEC